MGLFCAHFLGLHYSYTTQPDRDKLTQRTMKTLLLTLPTLGQEIGSGVHGAVYDLLDDPHKAIKIAFTEDDTYAQVQALYQFVQAHPHPALATIFEFSELCRSTGWVDPYYSVKMEKLYPLTDDEQRVMKSICLDYNGHLEPGKAAQHIEELQEWLDFDPEQVKAFYTALSTLPVIHRDFHRRNIMKDRQGNFKLIDFELLTIKQEKPDVQ